MPTPNLNSDDYYEILGCNRSDNDAALKKAYRKLAVKWHPDKNPDDETATKNFQKISEAYAILSDEKKRKLYDQYGVEGANMADHVDESQMPGGMGGFGGFGGPRGGGGVQHMSQEEAEQFFSQFFGGSDPFGGMMGGGGGFGGGPAMSFRSSVPMGGSIPGRGRSHVSHFGDGDPISMMFEGFGGGGPGMSANMGGMGGMPGGRSSYAQQKPQPVRFDAIPPGTVVSLKGLVNAPERNGDRGTVKHYISSTGRYVVELEDSDETMSVKPNNLLQHVHVRIHDIQNQPDLNGKTGTIIAWNEAKQRYNIYVMALQKIVSLRPNNVVLEVGTVAQITGLNSRPELNGKWGTIKEWIRETNKYDVQMSPQHVIRVKVENTRV